jgi:hypothetical protein
LSSMGASIGIEFHPLAMANEKWKMTNGKWI